MKFTVNEITKDGWRLITLDCGHQISCGGGVTGEFLNKASCWDCKEKAWHEAGKCEPTSNWSDCTYCGIEKR